MKEFTFDPITADFGKDGEISFVNPEIADQFIKKLCDEFGGNFEEGVDYDLYEVEKIYYDADEALTDWIETDDT